MVSCSMRYSVSAAFSTALSVDICSLFVRIVLTAKRLRKWIGGGLVTGEVDGRVLVELGQPVVGLDHAHGAGLRPHHDRLRRAPAARVADTLEQVAVGDAGGGEEDV